MGKVSAIMLAVLAGGLIPLQGAVNSKLGNLLSHPLQAAFISFFTGTMVLAVLMQVLNVGYPSFTQLKQINMFMYFGGILGVTFITANIIFIPKIGVVLMLLAALFGQLIVSIVFDHNGYFDVPQKSIDVNRIMGLFCVIFGLYFMQK